MPAVLASKHNVCVLNTTKMYYDAFGPNCRPGIPLFIQNSLHLHDVPAKGVVWYEGMGFVCAFVVCPLQSANIWGAVQHCGFV